MSERVPAPNKTSTTPSQATQSSSPLLGRQLTSELSESVGSSSNISKELGGIQPKTIRRRLNWENITVEAPSRGNGISLPGGIQRQQGEPSAVIGETVSTDSAQKSPLESSNSKISTDLPAQKPLIARAPFNGRNIPVEGPNRSSASSTYPGGIQRLETSEVKEQEKSTESLQMQPEEAIQAPSSEGEPQEKEEQNKELVQTKLTVGAPGDKYEQEADSMATKVMTMPDSAIQQPIQHQTDEGTEAVQMQPLVNSITPLVQRQTAEDSEYGDDTVELIARYGDDAINALPNLAKELPPEQLKILVENIKSGRVTGDVSDALHRVAVGGTNTIGAIGELNGFNRAIERGYDRVEVIKPPSGKGVSQGVKSPEAKTFKGVGEFRLEQKTATEPPKYSQWKKHFDKANKQIKESGFQGDIQFDFRNVDITTGELNNQTQMEWFIADRMREDRATSINYFEILWKQPDGTVMKTYRSRNVDGKVTEIITEAL